MTMKLLLKRYFETTSKIYSIANENKNLNKNFV